jgi:hypothetical protein
MIIFSRVGLTSVKFLAVIKEGGAILPFEKQADSFDIARVDIRVPPPFRFSRYLSNFTSREKAAKEGQTDRPSANRIPDYS